MRRLTNRERLRLPDEGAPFDMGIFGRLKQAASTVVPEPAPKKLEDRLLEYKPAPGATDAAGKPVIKDPTPRCRVEDRDIVRLAYGKCRKCWGSGYLVFAHQLMAPKGTVRHRNAKGEPTAFFASDTKLPIRHPFQRRLGMVNEKSGKVNFVRRVVDPAEQVKEVCKCAILRFIRLQPTDLDPQTGDLYFREPIAHMSDETKKAHEELVARWRASNEVARTSGDVVAASAAEVPPAVPGADNGNAET